MGGYAMVSGGVAVGGGMVVRERSPGWGEGCGGDVPAETPPDPFPDPFDDQDAILELEEEITTLAAHIHAAEHRFLELIAEFDRRGGWKLGGHRNCAEWLHFATGLSRGAARERVRAARALRRMPLTSEAMSRGELSFSKVRALTRVVDDLAGTGPGAEDGADVGDPEAGAAGVADSAREAELLAYARQCPTAEVERLVRGWRLTSAADEVELERRRHASRYVAVSPQGDGMYTLRGRLDPEVGALLMRALEAAEDALFRQGEDWAPEGGPRGPKTREVSPRQRRADAIGLLAERALAAGFGTVPPKRGRKAGAEAAEEEAGDESASGESGAGESDGDASGTGCSCAQPPLSGTRAERYQVVLHVDQATLRGDEGGADPVGAAAETDAPGDPGAGPRSHLSDGTRVSAETARRLGCDAAAVTVLRGSDGSVLDVGRRTRTIPPALRRALEIRDGGCRFPGCGLRFCDSHHIVHWALGGETKLENLVLLCRHHHRGMHEGGFKVRMGRDGQPRFFDRTGWPLPNARPPKRLAKGAWERMIEVHRKRGLKPAPGDAGARFKRRAHIPGELEGRARDALDPPG
jgi:hypothetical protein